MYKVMIVEDDRSLCKEIAEGLSRWGFITKIADTFDDLLAEFTQNIPHLVLMDINLPCFDGFYWCRKIREVSKVPIIFLSSRDSNMDIVMAINMGGDDYITKPFSMDVLLAKINGLVRRTYSYGDESPEVIEYKGAILNVLNNTLIYKDGKISLTKNEFKILYMLMKNQGSIISRQRIMRSLWEDESFIDDNTLTVNVNRLRNKLESIGLKDFITTKKGQGYALL